MESVSSDKFSILESLEGEYDEISRLTESVEVVSDIKLLGFYQKRLREIEDVALTFKEYKNKKQNTQSFDEELEKFNLFNLLDKLSPKIKQRANLEITKKSGDDRFVDELVSAMKKYAEVSNFEFEISNQSEKNASLSLVGAGVSDELKPLSGEIKFIFRGQDNSLTLVVIDSQVESKPFMESDVEFQISRSSGAGGQHINKTESNVKAIHIPTGISCECQQNRSQLQNKQAALEGLKIKVEKFYQKNSENYTKIQRKDMQNAIFSNSPKLIFDYDKNEVTKTSEKITKKLGEINEKSIKIIL